MSPKAEITKARLSECSKEEFSGLCQVFSKYLRDDDDKEHPELSKADPLGGKAKIANRLYRQACVDSGVSLRFFNNFDAWRRFVHGEIEETEFYAKAIEEISKLGREQRSCN